VSVPLLQALNFDEPDSILPAPDDSIDSEQLAILLNLIDGLSDDTVWADPDDGVTYDQIALASGITQSQIALASGITQSQIALASGVRQEQITIPEDEVVATAQYSAYQGTKVIIPWKFTNTNTTGFTFRSRLKYPDSATVTTFGSVNNTSPAASGGGEGTIVLTAAQTALLPAGDYRLWVDRTDSDYEDALIDATITIVSFA
jgi:hypothetical protein